MEGYDKKTLPLDSPIKQKNYKLYSAESFSQGKGPDSNEDKWIMTPHLVAVIDGATAKTPIFFDGRTSGEYASYVTGNILTNIEKGLYGKQLVDTITQRFNHEIRQLNLFVDLEKTPQARPTASFVAACILETEIIVTQVGDVAFRVNGQKVYTNSKEIDEINAQMRINAIVQATKENPSLPINELMLRGRNAIMDSLSTQISAYQNNPDHPLGFGVIDGNPVPDKYAKIYKFNKKDIFILEIFSDGYFKVSDEATIKSWEKAFEEVEKEDPYKISKYPSTKGSYDNNFTDDRTVLIAKIK